MTESNFAPTYHLNGTVTYWSVRKQAWQKRVGHVPDEDLAAMTEETRAKVLSWLAAGETDEEQTLGAVRALAREAAAEAVEQGARRPWRGGYDTCVGGDWDALCSLLGREPTRAEKRAWDVVYVEHIEAHGADD